MDHTPRSEELLMDGKHSILWRKNQSMEQISLLMKLKSIKLLFILILSLKMNKNEETKAHCFCYSLNIDCMIFATVVYY